MGFGEKRCRKHLPLRVSGQILRYVSPVLSIAFVAFLVWKAYSTSAGLGHAALAVIGLVAVWMLIGTVRDTRRLRESESTLANRPCPFCNTPFGEQLARDTFHPPPPPKRKLTELVFEDDWGMSLIACPNCSETCIFHRNSAKLQWKVGDEIHADA